MKRPWFYLFSVLFLIFLYLNYSEITQISRIIRNSTPLYIILAIGCEIISFIFLAYAHRESLRVVNIKRSMKKCIALVLKALAVNVTAPTGGTIGSTVFAVDAKQNDDSSVAAVTGIFLLMVTDFVALSSLVFFSIYYLSSIHELKRSYILAVIVFFVIGITIAGALIMAAENPNLLKNIFNYMNNRYNRILKFFKKPTNKGSWIEPSIDELSAISKSALHHPLQMLDTLVFLVLGHLFGIIALFFTFLALQIDPYASIIIISYVVVIVFKVATPTPEGIGFAEGALALTLNSFGLAPLSAIAVALTFRFISFWLPFGLGFGILQHSNLKTKIDLP